MSNKRFTEEFKLEAIKLIAGRQHSITEVSAKSLSKRGKLLDHYE